MTSLKSAIRGAVLLILVLATSTARGQGGLHVLWRTNAHLYSVASLSFSKDGSLIASASGEGESGKVWRVADAGLHLSIDPFRPNDAVLSVDFSPDGNYLVAGGGGESDISEYSWSRLRLIRVADKTLIWDLVAGIGGYYVPVRFSPDGSRLAYAGPWRPAKSGYIYLMSVDTGTEINTFYDFDSFVNHRPFAWSFDSRYFASVGEYLDNDYENLLNGIYPRLWNPNEVCSQNGFCYIKTLEGHAGSISCLAFSPTTNLLATGGGDRMVRFWNIPEGTTNREFQAHDAGLNFLAFAHEGKLLVSCDGREMKFWRVSDGALLKVYDQGIQGESAIAVSPDGRFLSLGGYDGSLTVALMPLWIEQITRNGNEVTLQWHGGSGLYQLQARNDLSSGDWQSVGNPTTNTVVTHSCLSPIFFRIQSLPNP